MRKCPKCKLEKDEIEFWKTCSYCKPCQREHHNNRINKNKEAYAERRKILWKRKNGRECMNCGETFVGKGRTREFCSTKCNLMGSITKRKTGCWEWNGILGIHGYAYTTDYQTNKRTHAHRVSYENFKGSIPSGLYVCHHCDNRKCINPEHLFVGTATENMQDAKQKNRLRCNPSKGSKNGHAKLDEEKVREIKQKIASGIRCTVIAREYGVGSTIIYRIKDGTGWKHVE